MCKKITLIIAVVVLLIGVQSLIAQERDLDRPREGELRDPPRPAERQAVIGERGERAEQGDIDRGRRERAGRGDQPDPGPPVAEEGRRRPAAPTAPAKTGPVQEGLGKWLDELTKAYRANDREKMGEIIRQMQQLRQQMPGKVFGQRGQDFDQGPKVEKRRPGVEKKAPKLAEKTPQPAKKPPQVWKDQQGGFPGGQAGWGVCPRCGRCPLCGAMAGRGMAFQGRGFGWRRQEVRPPALRDRPAAPSTPQDVPAPMRPESPRGFGWWRQQGSPPRFMDRPGGPAPREDMVRPMPSQPGAGPGRRGWGPRPLSPMAPDGKPEPAEPRPD